MTTQGVQDKALDGHQDGGNGNATRDHQVPQNRTGYVVAVIRNSSENVNGNYSVIELQYSAGNEMENSGESVMQKVIDNAKQCGILRV